MLYRLFILLLSTLPVLIGLSGYVEYTKLLETRKKLLGWVYAESEMNTYDLLAYIALTALFVLLPLLLSHSLSLLREGLPFKRLKISNKKVHFNIENKKRPLEEENTSSSTFNQMLLL